MDPAGPRNYLSQLSQETTAQTSESSKELEEFDKMVAMFTPTIREHFFQEDHPADDVDFAPNIEPNYKGDKEQLAARAEVFSLATVLWEYGHKIEACRIFSSLVKNYECTRSAEKLALPEFREFVSLHQSSIEN